MKANGIDMYHGDNREDAHLSDAQLVDKFKGMLDAGIFWIFHKVSEGTDVVDPRFLRRRDCAKRAGYRFFGGYHFLHRTNIQAQADNFIKSAQDDGVMAFATDFEQSSYTPTLANARDFGALVDTNYKVRSKLYGGGLIRDLLQPIKAGHVNPRMVSIEQAFAKRDLWLSEYGPHERIPWPWSDPKIGALVNGEEAAPGAWAWQYSEKGRVAEIVGNVDLNWFNGTADDMAKRWR